MLKPAPPDVKNPADVERYRKDMAAFFKAPEKWGWQSGPKPQPENHGDQDCYREHGVLKRLSDGKEVEAKQK